MTPELMLLNTIKSTPLRKVKAMKQRTWDIERNGQNRVIHWTVKVEEVKKSGTQFVSSGKPSSQKSLCIPQLQIFPN